MSRRIFVRACRAPRPGRFHTAVALLSISALLSPSALAAQAGTPPTGRDTVVADTAARRIEGVLVQAIRAGNEAPIAQKTIDRAQITARQFGQDVPMLLMQAAPR